MSDQITTIALVTIIIAVTSFFMGKALPFFLTEERLKEDGLREGVIRNYMSDVYRGGSKRIWTCVSVEYPEIGGISRRSMLPIYVIQNRMERILMPKANHRSINVGYTFALTFGRAALQPSLASEFLIIDGATIVFAVQGSGA